MSKIEKLLTETKPALIINEMQVGNIKMFPALGNEVERRETVKHIATLAGKFREKGLPVFHTPAMHRPDFADVKNNTMISSILLKTQAMIAGTDEAAYLPGLEPEPSDLVSARSSGLFALQGTDLNVRLRRMGVDTVVATGVSTNLGIPALACAAVDLGYHVIVPEDCIAGSDAEVHEILVREQLRIIANITNSEELMSILDKQT